MTYKAPDPGKGWRLLKVGEVKPSDTQFKYTSIPNDTWDECPTNGSIVSEFSLACGVLYRTREGVKQVKERNPKVYTAKAEVTIPPDYLKAEKWRKLALKMSKAKTIREAREIHRKAVGK